MFTASWVDSNNDGKIDAKDKLSYTLDTAWEGLFWANGISTGTECLLVALMLPLRRAQP